MALAQSAQGEDIPKRLRPWLGLQSWQRDTQGPVLSLGDAAAFDSHHVFAPTVAHEHGRYWLWYCGSRGKVSERVFQLGLATSRNGREFARHPASPVLAMQNSKHSIVTPTLLKSADGAPLRESGKLRMWFSSARLADRQGVSTLHESFSEDGLRWEEPSDSLFENVYAPTVLQVDDHYQMWYVDVSHRPRWAIRHASSADGRKWTVTKQPVLRVDQDWEHLRVNYPTVLRVSGGPPGHQAADQREADEPVYLMWYGSRTEPGPRTAIGFAASVDGIHWHKHPGNPVLRPEPQRPWESHYTSSQSVVRLPDGSFRIWYASRTKPPHVNKYFAINTAVWKSALAKIE